MAEKIKAYFDSDLSPADRQKILGCAAITEAIKTGLKHTERTLPASDHPDNYKFFHNGTPASCPSCPVVVEPSRLEFVSGDTEVHVAIINSAQAGCIK